MPFSLNLAGNQKKDQATDDDFFLFIFAHDEFASSIVSFQRDVTSFQKSIFPLASISKTLIPAAVMHLVERDLVDLDTDINRYLNEPHRRIYHPDYSSHSITLRKLLSHSASIAVSPDLLNTYYQPDDTALEQSLAEFCFKYVNPNMSHWLPAPPDRVTLYSNEGSALAALVVERVANISYTQCI